MDKRLDTLVLVVIIATVLILFALTFKFWQIETSKDPPAQDITPIPEKPAYENKSPRDSQLYPEIDDTSKSMDQIIARSDKTDTSAKRQLEIDSPGLDQPASQKQPAFGSGAPEDPMSDGNYMVIAGAFSQHENALKMTNRLKNIGFEAGIVKNKDGTISRVFAGKYETKDLADATVNELSARGIDSYVKSQK